MARRFRSGLWDGSTENKTVVRSLLADLVGRGLKFDDGLLVVTDGAKALAAAVREVFDERRYGRGVGDQRLLTGHIKASNVVGRAAHPRLVSDRTPLSLRRSEGEGRNRNDQSCNASGNPGRRGRFTVFDGGPAVGRP